MGQAASSEQLVVDGVRKIVFMTIAAGTMELCLGAPAVLEDTATVMGAGVGRSPDGASSRLDYDRALPFMAKEALNAGHELPLPFGVALAFTGLGNRQIDVTGVRVGIQHSRQSVREFEILGSSSDVLNANLKFDAWLLPFLNIYAPAGYVHSESKTVA